MKKAIAFIIIIVFLTFYIAGTSSSLMQKIAPEKYSSNSLFASDRYRYGDLFGFSYLKEFKTPPERERLPSFTGGNNKNINLYLVCDSYLYRFIDTGSIFYGVNSMKHSRWAFNEGINEQLDSTKKNILIIELSERSLRKFLENNAELYSLMYSGKNRDIIINNPYKLSRLERSEKFLFRSLANQNLENNLFDFQFLSPIKEFKAEFNYEVFGRTDIDVVVSKDKEYLFYGTTTDTSLNTSSFNAVPDNEISRLVSNINDAYAHFRNLGFDEVYISLIPNPVTIIEPDRGKYNELIPKIQNFSTLKTPVIDIFSVFKNIKLPVYFRSDSHWNSYGFKLWVDETNKVLKKESGY